MPRRPSQSLEAERPAATSSATVATAGSNSTSLSATPAAVAAVAADGPLGNYSYKLGGYGSEASPIDATSEGGNLCARHKLEEEGRKGKGRRKKRRGGPGVWASPADDDVAANAAFVGDDYDGYYCDGCARGDADEALADEEAFGDVADFHAAERGGVGAFFSIFRRKVAQLSWLQLAFILVLMALMMAGNAIQIIGLNHWLRSFPGAERSGSYTILTLSGIIFAVVFLVVLAVYVIWASPDMTFARDCNGWALLYGIGLSDTLNSFMNIYAANHTPEVLQALFQSLMPIFTCLLTKAILSDPRSYRNPWIYVSFSLTIAGVLIAAIPNILGGGEMGDGGLPSLSDESTSSSASSESSYFSRLALSIPPEQRNMLLWSLIFSLSVPFTALMNVWQTKYMEDFTVIAQPTLPDAPTAAVSDERSGHQHNIVGLGDTNNGDGSGGYSSTQSPLSPTNAAAVITDDGECRVCDAQRTLAAAAADAKQRCEERRASSPTLLSSSPTGSASQSASASGAASPALSAAAAGGDGRSSAGKAANKGYTYVYGGLPPPAPVLRSGDSSPSGPKRVSFCLSPAHRPGGRHNNNGHHGRFHVFSSSGDGYGSGNDRNRGFVRSLASALCCFGSGGRDGDEEGGEGSNGDRESNSHTPPPEVIAAMLRRRAQRRQQLRCRRNTRLYTRRRAAARGEDTIVKLVMLAAGTTIQAIISVALLPADALPWWGSAASTAEAWETFVSNSAFVFTDSANAFGAALYSAGFIFTYIGGAYLNQYSPTLCSMVGQLSSPMTALILVLVPSLALQPGAGEWGWSVAAVVLLSAATVIYSLWEELSTQELALAAVAARSDEVEEGRDEKAKASAGEGASAHRNASHHHASIEMGEATGLLNPQQPASSSSRRYGAA